MDTASIYTVKKKRLNFLQNIIHVLMLQFHFFCASIMQARQTSQPCCSFQRMTSHFRFLPLKLSNFKFQLFYNSWITTLCPDDLMLFSLCIGYLTYSIEYSVWDLYSTFYIMRHLMWEHLISSIRTIDINNLDLLQCLCLLLF